MGKSAKRPPDYSGPYMGDQHEDEEARRASLLAWVIFILLMIGMVGTLAWIL